MDSKTQNRLTEAQKIDIEQVAWRLAALVAPAAGTVGEMGGLKATDRLLPQARRIITPDVAKKLDEITRNDASKDIFVMLKKERLSPLAPGSVYLYVALLAEAVEDGIHSQETMARYYAAMGGYKELSGRADQLEEAEWYKQAEHMHRLALACVKLYPYPDYRNAICFFDLAANLDGQGRKREAMDCLKLVLSEYDRLDARSKEFSNTKQIRDTSASLLKKCGMM